MTTLNEQQYTSLIQSITATILNSNDEFGMGEMGEAHLIAEQTVMKWAEENNISLPNN